MKTIYTYIVITLMLIAPTKSWCQKTEKVVKNPVCIIKVDDNRDKATVGFPKAFVEVDDRNDTITKITIGRRRFEFIEKGNNTNVRMVYLPKESFKGHFAGVNLAFCNYMGAGHSASLQDEASFMTLNGGKSMAFSINFLQYDIGLQKYKHNFGLVTGLGWTVYNYRMDSQYILSTDDNNNTIGSLVQDPTIRKSKIVTSFLNIPLMLEAQIPSDTRRSKAHISAGVYGGFRIGSHTKVVYEGRNKDKSRENINLNPFQYGAILQVGYKMIKLYGTYNFSTLYEKGNGPELYPYSVGITLLTL